MEEKTAPPQAVVRKEERPQDPTRRRLLSHGTVLAIGAAAAAVSGIGNKSQSAEAGSGTHSNPATPNPDVLTPRINLLHSENLPKNPIKNERVDLEGKDKDEVLRQFKEFLGGYFSDRGIEELRQRKWLEDGELLARKEGAQDGGTTVLYYPERPYEPVFVISDGVMNSDGEKGVIKRATFYTDYAGNDQMPEFKDRVIAMMSNTAKGAKFEESKIESEDSRDYLVKYAADIPVMNRTGVFMETGENFHLQRSMLLKNEGVLELNEIKTIVTNQSLDKVPM